MFTLHKQLAKWLLKAWQPTQSFPLLCAQISRFGILRTYGTVQWSEKEELQALSLQYEE